MALTAKPWDPVSAAQTFTSTTVVATSCILRGLHFNDTTGGTPGFVRLRDGGSSGTILVQIDTPGGGVGEDVQIPGGGVQFSTNLYVEVSGVNAVTVFYQS